MSSSLCDRCSITFTIFKRKHRCVACKLLFCTSCFKKGLNLPERNVKHCLKCHSFSSIPLRASDLMLLTIKELKSFLQQNNVPMVGCTEKKDLVEAIINHERPVQPSSNSSTYRSCNSQLHGGTSSSFHNESLNDQSTSPGISSSHSNYLTPQAEAFIGMLNRELVNAEARNDSFYDQSTSPSSSSAHSNSVPPQAGTFLGMLNREFGHSEASSNVNTTDVSNRNLLHTIFVLNEDGVDEVQQQEHNTGNPITANQIQSNSSSKPVQNNSSSKPVQVLPENCDDSNEIKKLSVKELKSLLDENFVDYKGCCEKDELIQRVSMLWQSKKTKGMESGDNDNTTGESDHCKVCMDNAIDCVLLECGHMMTCVECGKKLRECPMCRQNISRIVRVFKS